LFASKDLKTWQTWTAFHDPNFGICNTSICKYHHALLINYSWGNQQGTEFLAEAVFPGTEKQFLRGWFPDQGKGKHEPASPK
jgi:hypothetical protein